MTRHGGGREKYIAASEQEGKEDGSLSPRGGRGSVTVTSSRAYSRGRAIGRRASADFDRSRIERTGQRFHEATKTRPEA